MGTSSPIATSVALSDAPIPFERLPFTVIVHLHDSEFSVIARCSELFVARAARDGWNAAYKHVRAGILDTERVEFVA